MKSCPTCKRTFEDTTVFCLVDGSILSAPFDPEATRHLPNTHNEPPLAETMNPAPARNPLPPTIASPVPTITVQQANPIYPLPSDESASHKKKFRLVYIGVPLALLLVGAGILFYVLRPFGQCPIIRVECFSGGDRGICDVIVEEARASTRNYRLDTGQLLCSLNPAMALQGPALPKTVTDVRWTVSPGRIQAQDRQFLQIDTTGLSGREITVTAKVSGHGWLCSNTASTSFIAK